VLLTLLTLSSIYYFAPAKKENFRFISAGSILATFLFMISSVGFNLYINNFSRYNALYGSIGTLLIILLWIYFNAIILLIGFELNASIAGYKSQIEEDKKEIKNHLKVHVRN
jgi:membrane protein